MSFENVSTTLLPNRTNALTPRGGVAFDGSGAQVLATLTNQSVGTDSLSISGVFRVPSANPPVEAILAALNSSSTSIAGSSLRLLLTTAGTLVVEFYNAAGSSTRVLTVANFVTNYGGKVVHVTFVRNSSAVTGTIYINGVAVTATETTTGGTPPTWADSITSTYFFSGRVPSSQVLVGAVYALSLYNLALDAASVLEIYEIGGAVPQRFKFGSQAERIVSISRNSDFSAGVGNTDWGQSVNGTGAVNAGTGKFDITAATNGGRTTLTTSGGLVGAVPAPCRRFRVTYSISNFARTGGGVIDFYFGGTLANQLVRPGIAADGSYADEFTLDPAIGVNTSMRFTVSTAGADTVTFSLDNISIKQIGAVVHLPLDDGIGFQLQDVSTNRLHALMTTAGVSHVAPLYGPARIRTTTDTSGSAQQLCGGATLPELSQILRIRARAASGTPTIILGTSGGGTQVVASVALSTTWKDLTIALTGGIVTSASSLYATVGTSGIAVDIDVTWEPLSP